MCMYIVISSSRYPAYHRICHSDELYLVGGDALQDMFSLHDEMLYWWVFNILIISTHQLTCTEFKIKRLLLGKTIFTS